MGGRRARVATRLVVGAAALALAAPAAVRRHADAQSAPDAPRLFRTGVNREGRFPDSDGVAGIDERDAPGIEHGP